MGKRTENRKLFPFRGDGMKEMWVGFVFLVALVVLGFATLVVRNVSPAALLFGTQEAYFYVKADHAMGLQEGDYVRCDGVPFGKVKRVFLTEPEPGGKFGVRIHCRLYEPVQLFEGYKIVIEGFALIGGAYVSIHRGDPTSRVVKAEIRGHDLDDPRAALPSITDVGAMKKASEVLTDNEGKIRDVLASLREASAGFRDLLDGLRKGEGFVPEQIRGVRTDLSDALSGVRKSAEETLQTAQEEIRKISADARTALRTGDDMLRTAKAAADSLKEAVDKIRRGEGTAGKLLNSSEAHDELVRLLKDARAAIENLQDPKGVLYAATRDPQMTADVKAAVQEIRGAAESANKVLKAVEGGWVPKLLQDEGVRKKVEDSLEGLDKTIGRVGRSKTYLQTGGFTFPESNLTLAKLTAAFWPEEGKMISFGASLMNWDAGEHAILDPGDNSHEQVTLDAQLGYGLPILPALMVRAGLLEGKLGGGVDLGWEEWGLFRHPVRFTFEARDTYRGDDSDIDEDLEGPLYRAYVKVPMFPRGTGWFGDFLASIHLMGGVSRLFASPDRGGNEWFVGASLEYEEKDIRTILGLAGSAP